MNEEVEDKKSLLIYNNTTRSLSSPALSQVQLLSKDFGKHLLEVDDLLQKHSLQEADIAVQAERVETLNTAALKFTTIEGIHASILCIVYSAGEVCNFVVFSFI